MMMLTSGPFIGGYISANRRALVWGVSRQTVRFLPTYERAASRLMFFTIEFLKAVTTNVKPPRLSIAVRAWNEEAIIGRALNSIFHQSLFDELSKRGETCEVLCIPNGCTDSTAEIATAVMAKQADSHPFAHAFIGSVRNMREAGRNHTWNAYVHELSHPQAEFLFLMDSDILFNRPDTLFKLYQALLENPEAKIASDQPIKDVELKPRKSWRDSISLATSDMNGAIQGRMTGQLYCIRAETARGLYLPKDLGIDDGFIK